MPLNNSGFVALSALVAGCGSGNGYSEAPYIAAPPVEGQRVVPGAGPMAPQFDPPRATVPVSSLDEPPPPPDMPQSPGPRGTSSQDRYDGVGYAGTFVGQGQAQYSIATVSVAHGSLPIGSYVELTALDTGRTIVALVAARGGTGHIVDLSPGAAQQLGTGEGAPVRVRLVNPSPQDQTALRSGQPATARMEAPQSLLVALRRKLPARSEPSYGRPQPPRPAASAGGARAVQPSPAATRPGARYTPPPAQPAPISGSGYVVQVAAFSTRERAETVARQVGGRISPAGNLFRVQIGPFANTAAAQRARDDAARRGYGDARILHVE